MRFLLPFSNTFLRIPLALSQSSHSRHHHSFPPPIPGGTWLLWRRNSASVIRSYIDDLAEEEEICSICLTEFTRGDSSPVCQLLDCPFQLHPEIGGLYRRFFNIHKKTNDLRFVVPDNPSSLYYFLHSFLLINCLRIWKFCCSISNSFV